MNIATAQQQLTARHHHHFVLRENFLQDGLGLCIHRVIKARRDNAAVDDQKVHVRTGQAFRRITILAACNLVDAITLFLGGVHRPRNRHFVHHKRPPLGVRAGRQNVHRRMTTHIVGIALIVSPGQQHLARRNVAAEVIHMAVGFIIEQTIRQPDNLIHSQICTQHAFDFFAGQVRVAVAVHQALSRSNQRAFTVNVNRAAFQHKTFGVVTRATFYFQHLAAHLLVAVPRKVQTTVKPAPGVEIPVHTTHFTAVVDDKGRPAVAYPGIVAGHFDHTNIRHIKLRTGIFILGCRHPDSHRFKARNGLGHCRVRRLRRLAAQAPVVRTLRPDHPGLGLRSPFGRHIKAVSARRTVQSGHLDS